MNNTEEKVRNMLFEMQDMKYKAFHQKLIPGVDPDTVIGIRTPKLRSFAKELSKTPESQEFLRILPHKYYDENNLHGFLIEGIRDYDVLIGEIEAFLPYIDNWATCDLISPKAFKKHLPELYEKIRVWIKSDHTYTVRFAIEMLMSFYLGDGFTDEIPAIVAAVDSDEYYVKMMVAWYFATALVKQRDASMPYIEQRRLEKWTHNKAIQKAVESYRVDDETKTYLRTLKIK